MQERFFSQEAALPLVVEPFGSVESTLAGLEDAIRGSRAWIDERLHEHGAVLFRGFEIHGDADFDRLCRAYSPALRTYVEGNSPREVIHDRVYTSTVYPAEYRISLHSELSYAHDPPTRLFFYCRVAPEGGGETPLADSRRLLRSLDTSLLERFRRRGVRYVQNLPNGRGLGRSWQETFETEDRAAVEEHLRRADLTYRWKEDGSLWTSRLRPATRIHPVTGEECWFNQADQWHLSNLDAETRSAIEELVQEDEYPLDVFYGDGTRIDEVDLQTLREVAWEQAVTFPWREGDFLVIDNLLVEHGRRPYQGAREVRVAMC